MLNLLIARHGQSEWNALGRWQGHADPPLSPAGLAQARAAGRSIGSFDAVVASDLERAIHTAKIIADAIGSGPVMTDPGFRERDVGEWQGLTRDEIESSHPGALREGSRPSGWESNASLLKRSLAALDRVAEHVGAGDVLVVSHGGVIYALEEHLGFEFTPIRNLHGRWIHKTGSGLRAGDRIALAPDPAAAAAEI